jgi:hypothetical protein
MLRVPYAEIQLSQLTLVSRIASRYKSEFAGGRLARKLLICWVGGVCYIIPYFLDF